MNERGGKGGNERLSKKEGKKETNKKKGNADSFYDWYHSKLTDVFFNDDDDKNEWTGKRGNLQATTIVPIILAWGVLAIHI